MLAKKFNPKREHLWTPVDALFKTTGTHETIPYTL
jgi:hypothetical protein